MDDFLKAAVATLFLAIVLFPTLAMAQSLDERLQVMAGDTILKGQHPGGPGAPFALEATLSVSDDTAVRGARVPREPDLRVRIPRSRGTARGDRVRGRGPAQLPARGRSQDGARGGAGRARRRDSSR